MLFGGGFGSFLGWIGGSSFDLINVINCFGA